MTDSARSTFGTHLTLDLERCDPSTLADLSRIFDLLDKLPDLLNMTKVAPPYVFPYVGKVPDDRGITGFVVIAESHISVHTFELKGYAFVDVFSCKHFDTEEAKRFIVKALGAQCVKAHALTRGAGFPRSTAGHPA